MTFQIFFCCFSLDSLEFLHVALNSFRKHCSNVLSAALHFVCKKNLMIMGFKHKDMDKTFSEGMPCAETAKNPS